MSEGMKQDRGALILVLGIVSIVLCQILGPVAWVMGNNDLRDMQAGAMDPKGQGITQAGKICGVIGTIMLVLGILWAIFVFVLGIGSIALSAN